MNLTHVYKYGHIYLIRRKKGLVRIGLNAINNNQCVHGYDFGYITKTAMIIG